MHVELNWSTFVLEIINFLVLVWILKRFLYRPVLEVIARRRAGIEQTRAEAGRLHEEAQQLQSQYQNRLAEWDRERRAAREELSRELEAERARRLQILAEELAQERARAAVVEQRRHDEQRRQLEQTALAQGAQFAVRLLALAPGPQLQESLLALLLQQLGTLQTEQREALRSDAGAAAGRIRVTSAYSLDGPVRERLQQALDGLIGAPVAVQFDEDRDLLAGVRISVGAWVLQANVKDDLAGFARMAHEP
jgi:F-type H+-transporting ATPase subunit b